MLAPRRPLPHHRRAVIELSRSQLPGGLGPTSKLNRDPAFIAGLMAHGEARAGEFLTALAFESAWAAA